MQRLRERGEPPDDARARRKAHACLSDWRAAPEARRDELLALWEPAVTRAAFAHKRVVVASWIRSLRAIRGLERVPKLRMRRDAVEADYARLSELYARPAPLCEVVRDWRRRDFQPPVPEPVARAVRFQDAPRRPFGVFGVGPPDHNGYCDPVFGTLAPDDEFCG